MDNSLLLALHGAGIWIVARKIPEQSPGYGPIDLGFVTDRGNQSKAAERDHHPAAARRGGTRARGKYLRGGVASVLRRDQARGGGFAGGERWRFENGAWEAEADHGCYGYTFDFFFLL